MKLNIIVIVILGYSILFVTNQAYAPCIEGPGINCNNYPPPSLSQIKTDKLNYETSDKPIITIMGAPDAVAHLEIDDSSSNIMLFTHDIDLAPNGTARYVIDISSYKPGVYSAIATSPISKLTSNFAVGLSTTGPIITLNVLKDTYVQGDFITTIGTVGRNDTVQLSLIDPNDNVVTSIQTVSNDVGQYSTSALRIPTNAISGIWKITADHNISHTTIKITVQSSASNGVMKSNDPVIITLESPLKQFKSGIDPYHVICRQDLQLVIKSEDNSPACVKSTSLDRLLNQGWINTYNGNENSTQHTTLPASFMPCDTPYSKSDSGVPVMYMPANAIGKLCVKYTNYNNSTESFHGGISVFDPNNSYQGVPDVTTWNDLGNTTTIQGGQSFIATYWIKTGNHTGFYGLDLYCGGIPFAIGYNDSSKLVASDFPFVGLTYSCPAISYDTQIDSTTGIGVKHIPYSSSMP